MAGDVKYDSLPFIDSSGRDYFEAGSDFDIDTSIDNFELKSESVEHIQLNQKKSFDIFKDKYLDSSKVDFSDRISTSDKAGYDSKTVYEIIAEKAAIETPHQKYHRLQSEIQSLVEEVQSLKDSEDKDASAVSLSSEVLCLQKQLHDLQLEKYFGPHVFASHGVQPWTRQIVDQLQSIKTKMPDNKDPSHKDVVYEIYYRPEHSKFALLAKISELEAKLKAIETAVGIDNPKLQRIISDSSGNSLMDTTEQLHAKLSLFDITHIEIISARLQGLLHCINEISQRKDTIENVINQTKIDELYTLIKSWDSVATVVPDLIERLKALSILNEQATSFFQSMENLTINQSEVRDLLRTEKDTLNKFEKSFAENIASIQKNCEGLDKRIESLMKKIAT
ncbi:dynactin subunit 2-B isoform X2 [Hydra vulgaris]|uniref:Dynactin subunit 2-B isoform X2 n=1 Tax=Hydra vulgaris TaxID=6087 RepID=A0ABM4CTJ7_HYDVU